MAARYEMTLDPMWFDKVLRGKKTLEIRLNDEKRRGIKKGDEICFKLRGSDDEVCVKKVKKRDDCMETFSTALMEERWYLAGMMDFLHGLKIYGDLYGERVSKGEKIVLFYLEDV